ncbi:hypothetical protein DFH11DRAFT_1515820 [Phellopilus nigrolimitatus]|nr:hypothetical protein DFH11DRAFT_1515820 [Phellopilus nigrolimitatus]
MPDFRGPMGAAAAGLAPADGAPAGVPNQGPRPPRPPPRMRKEWTLPAPPGLTLRQRVEKRECEAGLRCDDVSCGIGPTDEDPVPESAPDAHKTISVRRDHIVSGGDEGGATKEAVCAHRFHPACLVDAGRVAGWGSRADEEGVEVSCPRCRAVGHVDKTEWEEGVRATEGQRFDNA